MSKKEIHDQTKAAIIREHQFGYTLQAIASSHDLEVSDVREVLRGHRRRQRANEPRPETKSEMTRAREKLMAEGHDPEVIKANFG